MSISIKVARDFTIECSGGDLHSILRDGYRKGDSRYPIPSHAKIHARSTKGLLPDQDVSVYDLRFRITWGETDEED